MTRRKQPAPPKPLAERTITVKKITLDEIENPDAARRLIKAMLRGVEMANERVKREKEKASSSE